VAGGTLHAFGSKSGPRRPRPGIDIAVDTNGMVHPTEPLTGASLFGDPQQVPLSGHHHWIPADLSLPPAVKITAVGIDVAGPHPPTHHTFSPTEPMPFADFVNSFMGLPCTYGGKK
jgi:hypothetical protein